MIDPEQSVALMKEFPGRDVTPTSAIPWIRECPIPSGWAQEGSVS